MGVYAITGGSGGIGLRVISQLEKQGHETINIDWKTGDIPGRPFYSRRTAESN